MRLKNNPKTTWAVSVSAALITFVAYLPALRNDFLTTWDDGSYILGNLHIRSLDTALFKWAFFSFSVHNWHPFTWISHALDYAVWGLNPAGHHLTSILLHAINTALVVFLIVRLLEAGKDRATDAGTREFLTERALFIIAGTTGVLFGLHPLHVESVAWVAERKDVLCALFFLMSVIWYTEYATSGHALREKVFASFLSRHYLFTTGFFVCALLSKPMAVTLPVVLLILDWYPLGRIRSLKSFIEAAIEKAPLALLSLLSSIVTIAAQQAGGAIRPASVIPLSDRIPVAAAAVLAYLGKMIRPLNLVPYYPYPPAGAGLSLPYLLAVAFVIGITAACVFLARKQKVWLAAWGYYAATLIPVVGIVQVGEQFMADRYTYLPSLGPFLLAGFFAVWTYGTVKTKKAGAIAAAGFVLVCLALALLTVRQIAVWRNSIDFWSHVIQKEPATLPFAYNNRGFAFAKKGMLQEAIADFDRAIALDPAFISPYINRGMFSGTLGRLEAAAADFTAAIALDPSNYQAYVNRGLTFAKMGEQERALDDYKTALALNPSSYETLYHLGILYLQKGMRGEAIEAFSRSLALNPQNADAYCNRGVAYALGNRPDRALEDYDRALGLNPKLVTAYLNRGNLSLKIGQQERARTDFQKACDLGDQTACSRLGSAPGGR